MRINVKKYRNINTGIYRNIWQSKVVNNNSGFYQLIIKIKVITSYVATKHIDYENKRTGK